MGVEAAFGRFANQRHCNIGLPPHQDANGRKPVDDWCQETRMALPQCHGRKSVVWGFTPGDTSRQRRDAAPTVRFPLHRNKRKKHSTVVERFFLGPGENRTPASAMRMPRYTT